jgi:stage V sporulation protein B
VSAGSSGREFAVNAALLTAARLSSAAALFALTVVAARLLGPDQLGSAAVGQTVGTIAALVANGGLNISTIYYLRRRADEQTDVVGPLTVLAMTTSTLAFSLALLSAPVIATVLGGEDWPLLVAAGVMGASMVAFEFAGALLLGFGHSRSFSMIETVRGWTSLAGVAVVVTLVAPDGHGLVIGIASGFAAAAVVGLVRTSRTAPLRARWDRRFIGEALSFGIRGQVGNVLQYLGVRLDLLLVPAILNLQLAGVYYVAVRVSDLVGQLATSTASFVFPHVAGQADVRDTELTARVTRMTLLVTTAAAVVVAILADSLLRFAFGPVYADGTPALLVLLAAVVPLSLGRLLAADLKGRGRPGLVSVSGVVAVVATVVLDLVLIPAWGIVGAAVASLIAYSMSATTLLVAYRAVTGGRLARLVPGLADASDLRSLVGRIARRLS